MLTLPVTTLARHVPHNLSGYSDPSSEKLTKIWRVCSTLLQRAPPFLGDWLGRKQISVQLLIVTGSVAEETLADGTPSRAARGATRLRGLTVTCSGLVDR